MKVSNNRITCMSNSNNFNLPVNNINLNSTKLSFL